MALTPERRSALRAIATNETQEGRELDFKREFYPGVSGDNESWSDLVKDIVAFSNSGGGAIVFGCDDEGKATEFSIELLAKLDPAKITDRVNSYTSEQFDVFAIERVERKDGTRLAWLIGPADFPLIFTKDGYRPPISGRMPVFRLGQLYFRHGAKSEPGTPIDIRSYFMRKLKEEAAAFGLRPNEPEELAVRVGGTYGASAAAAANPMDFAAVKDASGRGSQTKTAHARNGLKDVEESSTASSHC